MKTSNKGFDYCYNGQIVVDEEHQIIVAAEVTSQANDKQQAIPLAQATLENLAAAGIKLPKTSDEPDAPAKPIPRPVIKMLRGSWPGHDAPRHLWGFSPATLSRLLQQHGFRVEYVRHELPMPWYWKAVLFHWIQSHQSWSWIRPVVPLLGFCMLLPGAIAAVFHRGPFVKVVARKDA